jgi:phosphoserine phosphatase RsbU/P
MVCFDEGIMVTVVDSLLLDQLHDRRHKLENAIENFGENVELMHLLDEVDEALDRMDKGSFGFCKICKDPIEPDRLIADPLTQFCIDHLSAHQKNMLEKDLELAAHIQNVLLPKRNLSFDGWESAYHYEAAGPVSGDYCDLVSSEDGSLYFILGDVSGKGVAASMLMTQLHSMFRALISVGLQLSQIVERASSIFCESTLPTHFATLVCGRAGRAGEIEICNAGHLPPLLIRRGEIKIKRIDATGLPIGMFSDERFTVRRERLDPGDILLLYTDGLSETLNAADIEYGIDRLSRLASEYHSLSPQELIRTCMEDLTAYRSSSPKADDLTIMAIRRM